MRKLFYISALFFLLLQACSLPINTFKPKQSFDTTERPAPPDYSDTADWVALPQKKDFADLLAEDYLNDYQDSAKVDVFFVYPTIYTGTKKGQNEWNAHLDDEQLNESINTGTIQHQSSVFNGAAKIYAPRYRQAHLWIYYTKKNRPDAQKALDFAYQDVKTAFEYYMEHYNNGRPIIIASHSQGSNHAERLLLEYFDDKPLNDKLVAAYLVGMPIPADTFKTIKPCETPQETGCFCSWNTYLTGFYPKFYDVKLYRAVATNPVSWTITDKPASAAMNKGTLLGSFDIVNNLVGAKSHEGMVWIDKPSGKYWFMRAKKNWHIADYNLFYLNVRENVATRIESYLSK